MTNVFELNNTIQFTWVSSIAPDAAPTLKIRNNSLTVVASITSVQSDTTHFYAMYTTPGSEGAYIAEWLALKTVSGSAYQFVNRLGFIARETTIVQEIL